MDLDTTQNDYKRFDLHVIERLIWNG